MKVLEIYVTCPGVPTQIEGIVEDGRHFYFRERHGYWSFGLGVSQDAAVEDSFSGEYGGECDEFMPVDEAKGRAVGLIASISALASLRPTGENDGD